MRTHHPKDYLVLAYDTTAEDILIFVIRGVSTPAEAKRAVEQEYASNQWSNPAKIHTINLNGANKAGFLGRAQIHEVPRSPSVAQEHTYTPQIDYA